MGEFMNKEQITEKIKNDSFLISSVYSEDDTEEIIEISYNLGKHDLIKEIILNKQYKNVANVIFEDDKDNGTLFSHYVKDNNREMIDFLIENKADINYRYTNYNERTPLLEAINNSNEEIANLLISHGGKISYSNIHKVFRESILKMSAGFCAKIYNSEEFAINKDDIETFLDVSIDLDEKLKLITSRHRQFSFLSHLMYLSEKDSYHDKPEEIKKKASEMFPYVFKLFDFPVDYKNRGNDTLFVESIERVNYEALSFLIKEGAYTDRAVGNDNALTSTLLNYRDNLMEDVNKICSLLLKDDININFQNKSDLSPLFLAAKNGNIKIGKELLEKGAFINEFNDGETALHVAAASNNFEFVELLIKFNADLESIDRDGHTPVQSAFLNNNSESCSVLMSNNVNLDLKIDSGNSLFHILAKTSSNEVLLDRLIKENKKVDEPNKDGETPLMLLAQGYPTTKAISSLIDAGANVNAQDNSGETFMMKLAFTNRDDLIEFIIEKGADIYLVDNSGASAFDHSGATDYLTRTSEFLAKEEIKNKKMQASTVHRLAFHDNFELLSEAHKKTNINLLDKGEPVLFKSTKNNTRFKKLIKIGFDVHQKNSEGDSLLSLAVKKNRTTLTSLLIDKGLDSNNTNNKGESVLFQSDIEPLNIEYLKDPDFSIVNNEGQTLLHKNNPFILGYYMKQVLDSVDIDRQDSNGDTAVSLNFMNYEYVDKLIDLGARLDIENNDGETLLSKTTSQSLSQIGLSSDRKKRISFLEEMELKQDVYQDTESSIGL